MGNKSVWTHINMNGSAYKRVSFYCCDVLQNVSFVFQGFFVAFIYCFCNGEVILTLKNHANSRCCFLSLASLLNDFLRCAGADRGEEGLVKTKPHTGHQAELQDDQQCWRRQLLLRRRDVPHRRPQRQLVSGNSQRPLCRCRGGLRWLCWRRVRAEATTPQLCEQPACIRRRGPWGSPPATGADGVCRF